MTRFPLFVATLSCLSLLGCGSTGGSDSAVDSGSGTEDVGIQPQAGDWTVVTTGWSNDDCNAEENLSVPTSITFADVESSSFRVTYFEEGVQVGSNTTCTYEADDVYRCEDYTNGFSYTGMDANITLSGVGTITLSSETAAAGTADFVMECEGDDCSQVAKGTTSGVIPCGSTFNWTAEAN